MEKRCHTKTTRPIQQSNTTPILCIVKTSPSHNAWKTQTCKFNNLQTQWKLSSYDSKYFIAQKNDSGSDEIIIALKKEIDF